MKTMLFPKNNQILRAFTNKDLINKTENIAILISIRTEQERKIKNLLVSMMMYLLGARTTETKTSTLIDTNQNLTNQNKQTNMWKDLIRLATHEYTIQTWKKSRVLKTERNFKIGSLNDFHGDLQEVHIVVLRAEEWKADLAAQDHIKDLKASSNRSYTIIQMLKIPLVNLL